MSNETNLVRREESSPEQVKETPFAISRVDIYENDDELLMFADVPGVGQKDLSIHFDKNELTLEGHRSGDMEGNPLRAEYRYYDYRRTFVIPQGIDAENIHAELRDGVVKVHLPKSEALKPRQIQIKAS